MAVESATPLKDEGIVICTLGISPKIDREQLQAIASSKEKVLILSDLNVAGQMERISDEVRTAICEGKPRIYRIAEEIIAVTSLLASVILEESKMIVHY